MIIAVGLSGVTFLSQSSKSLYNFSIMSMAGRQALEVIARDLRLGYTVNEATSDKLDLKITFHQDSLGEANFLVIYENNQEFIFKKNFEDATI